MNSPKMTIFSTPKPFNDPHIATIQYNAIQSWKELGDDVSIFLIGDEYGVKELAHELGVNYAQDVIRNSQGTPLLSSIFELGRNLNQSPILAYINADIIIFSDFIVAAVNTSKQMDEFLLVGQRWDLEVNQRIDFSKNWQDALKDNCSKNGKLHPRGGSDYFIYPRKCFSTIPDFAVGRAGWDNWMFYQARRNNWACIDCSKAIQIIHQNHDYSHLPGGQTHYRLPETNENVRLAGGKRAIFTLMDVNYEMENNQIKKYPLSWKKFWREVEIFPLVTFKSKWLTQLFFSIFHPYKAYNEFRNMRSEIKKKERKDHAKRSKPCQIC